MSDIRARMAADDAEKPEPVDVPKWGRIFVRLHSAAEAEAFNKARGEVDDEEDEYKLARAVAMILCDESGERVFDPLKEEDLVFLSKRRAADLMRVLNAGSDSGN